MKKALTQVNRICGDHTGKPQREDEIHLQQRGMDEARRARTGFLRTCGASEIPVKEKKSRKNTISVRRFS